MSNPLEILNSVRDEDGRVREYYRGHVPAYCFGLVTGVIWFEGFQGDETMVDRGFQPSAIISVQVKEDEESSYSNS